MALLEMHIDSAFGAHGADKARYQHWLDTLTSAITRIRKTPKREAAPVLGLPSRTDDLTEIESVAGTIRDGFSTLVVVGMGGSSLSGETLAAIAKPGNVALRFIDNIDPYGMEEFTRTLDWRRAAFLVISKSGNTVETLALLSVLLRHAKEAGLDVSRHFFVITITDGNPLHTIAKAHGMRVIAHDPDLGGRFSILSAVGLIPAAVAGLDIHALRAGAGRVLEDNGDAARSAALHRALMEKNIRVNVTMPYCDRLNALAGWYRQCWGESLGKCAEATTPVRARGTTDQHSQLQLYLDGPKDKLFTLMLLENKGQGEPIGFPDGGDARLDFLKARSMGDLMAAQQRGTLDTLVRRGCPVRSFTLRELNEETLGGLLMHFMLEIMFTAELLGVNAFDQPAVEESKLLALGYLAG